jgi:hypothetical protein
MDQLRCDNYVTCKASVPVQASEAQTSMLARARGWHLWSGTTMGGEHKRVVLCKQCVGQHARYRMPAPVDPLGQDRLFA